MAQVTALQEFLEERFGGRFTIAPSQPAITNVQSQVLPNDFERMAYIMVNPGGSIVFVNFGTFQNLTSGIQLAPNGGSVSVNAHDDLCLPGFEAYAWTVSGASTLSIFAVKRYRGD